MRARPYAPAIDLPKDHIDIRTNPSCAGKGFAKSSRQQIRPGTSVLHGLVPRSLEPVPNSYLDLMLSTIGVSRVVDDDLVGQLPREKVTDVGAGR